MQLYSISDMLVSSKNSGDTVTDPVAVFSCLKADGTGAHSPSRRLFIFDDSEKEDICHMKHRASIEAQENREKVKSMNPGRLLYGAFLAPIAAVGVQSSALAADTIWTKASDIMKDVYTQILGISTIAAVVTASVALLLMNFSKSGRTVDESRAWLKRIIITWAILNSLGFILAYVTPFFNGGTWTP